MSHLPYIVASYVIAIGLPLVYAVTAAKRLKLARTRLAVFGPRAGR